MIFIIETLLFVILKRQTLKTLQDYERHKTNFHKTAPPTDTKGILKTLFGPENCSGVLRNGPQSTKLLLGKKRITLYEKIRATVRPQGLPDIQNGGTENTKEYDIV